MNGTRTSIQRSTVTGFFALVGGSLAIGLLGYHTSRRSYALWSTRTVLALAIAALVVLAAATLLVVAFRRAAGERRIRFWLPMTASALSLLACLGIAELAVRLIVRPDPLGVRFGARPLVPYSWRAVADTNLSRLRMLRSPASYFVEDSLLGWSVGADRESRDGMYRSSEDGIRTLRRAEPLRAAGIRRRVALFGDSFTFSMEVPFDQSWAYALGTMLPPGTQILDFGVDGFGVDQSYLRFHRDARKWAPSVDVLTFIQDDLYRTVSSYPFLRGWTYPFSRPRLFVDGDGLRMENVPVLPADSIFAKASIAEVPFVNRDIFFNADLWTPHVLYHSYLVRLVVTLFPRWPLPNEGTGTDVIVPLATRIIEQFVREARAEGAEPLVVYVPGRSDFASADPLLTPAIGRLLAERGIQLHDVTDCVTHRVAPRAMFLDGRPHYTGAANAAVAACVQPFIAPLLR